MDQDVRIHLLARVARSPSVPGRLLDPAKPLSILSLSAAAYGARPMEDATVPTGFDPVAVALFEAIVEGAYLVANADGVFDDEERRMFERVVSTACGASVPPRQITSLVSDLSDQLAEDGIDCRVAAVGQAVTKKEHAQEVLRIAALLAQASEDVSRVEREVLRKLAKACALDAREVDAAIDDVKKAMKAAG